MDNKYEAVLEFIKQFPLVGENLYFNFTDETSDDGNTMLYTMPYGQVIKRYVDGGKLLKMQFEIMQVKPLVTYSNSVGNAEEMQKVKQFMDWINEQGKTQNFPQWADCVIHDMYTTDGAEYPSMRGYGETGTLYSFGFEIIYEERN